MTGAKSEGASLRAVLDVALTVGQASWARCRHVPAEHAAASLDEALQSVLDSGALHAALASVVVAAVPGWAEAGGTAGVAVDDVRVEDRPDDPRASMRWKQVVGEVVTGVILDDADATVSRLLLVDVMQTRGRTPTRTGSTAWLGNCCVWTGQRHGLWPLPRCCASPTSATNCPPRLHHPPTCPQPRATRTVTGPGEPGQRDADRGRGDPGLAAARRPPSARRPERLHGTHAPARPPTAAAAPATEDRGPMSVRTRGGPAAPVMLTVAGPDLLTVIIDQRTGARYPPHRPAAPARLGIHIDQRQRHRRRRRRLLHQRTAYPRVAPPTATQLSRCCWTGPRPQVSPRAPANANATGPGLLPDPLPSRLLSHRRACPPPPCMPYLSTLD